MERIPGHDDELSIDEEAGSAAPLGEGRPPQGRARAGLVATAMAILGLACLALAYQVSPWHRAAATLGDHPRRQGQKRTRIFHSLNSNTEDQGTLSMEKVAKGGTVLQVQNADIFTEGDQILIVDSDDDSSMHEEAKVGSVGDGTITLNQPVSRDIPSFSFVIVPADPDSGTSKWTFGGDNNKKKQGLNTLPHAPTPAPPGPPQTVVLQRPDNMDSNGYGVDNFDCSAGEANWVGGWSEQKKKVCCQREQTGCEFNCDAGISNWKTGWSDSKKTFCCQTESKGCEDPGFRMNVFGIVACLIVACVVGLVLLYFFCFKGSPQSLLMMTPFRRCCAPKGRQKEVDGEEWMFKPSDGRAIMTLTTPDFDAPDTGDALEPGEIFAVSSSQGGGDNCSFLKLADGRGWVLDREPGHEMCYKLFEPVDELWLYDPENGCPMAIRDSPFVEGADTGKRLQPGEKFRVCQMQASSGSGIIFLKLMDGRGWVFDQKGDDLEGGEMMCRRVLQETWEYQPPNGAPFAVRLDPDVYAEKSGDYVNPGETFEVEEVVPGPDDELFLRLADGRGWLFDKHPNYGDICFKVQ